MILGSHRNPTSRLRVRQLPLNSQLPFEIVVIQTCPAEPVAKTAFKPRARAALWNTVAGCAL